jgi:sugar lactone lactonase YvrE
MTRVLLALATVAAVAAAVAGAQTFPSTIALPNGFQPEGIAVAGEQFYVGSIPTGAVYRGSLRTGEGAVFVQPQTGRAAIGMKVDRGRLFVAGGPTGQAYVYNARTGAAIRSYQLSTGGSFINDVVVTKKAAWLTDSMKPVLYRVPLGAAGRPGAASAFSTVSLTGDYVHGAGFNVNGIAATPNGKTLVIVQSSTGKLFTVNAMGATREITLTGSAGQPESVPRGDGILLDGKTLYVVQNTLNQIAKIALSPKLTSGRVLTRITNPGFDVPTTIAGHGSRLYAVNARFGTDPTPTTTYSVTQVGK